MTSFAELGEAFIQHYFDQAYDPVKAHEYYERTKQLKGRQPAKAQESKGRSTGTPPAYGVKKPKAAGPTPAQRKAKLEAEAAALKARLDELREILRKLVAEAKKRSGVDVDSEGKTSTADPKSEKDLTPAEKAEKAKKAHEYYEETKETLPSREPTHVLKKKIALIEKKIAEMRAKLASLPNEVLRAQVEPPSKEVLRAQVERPSPSGPENNTQVRKGDSQNGS